MVLHFLAAGDYLRLLRRHHVTDQRAYVLNDEQARSFDAAVAAPGGVLRKRMRLARGVEHTFPYCGLHPTQRIDTEPCLRCRIAVLETKLASAERTVDSLQSALRDLTPKILSLGDALAALTSCREDGTVVG